MDLGVVPLSLPGERSLDRARFVVHYQPFDAVERAVDENRYQPTDARRTRVLTRGSDRTRSAATPR